MGAEEVLLRKQKARSGSPIVTDAVFANPLPKHSFLLLRRCLDLLCQAGKDQHTDSATLKQCFADHLECVKACYGEEVIVPQCHMALRLPG